MTNYFFIVIFAPIRKQVKDLMMTITFNRWLLVISACAVAVMMNAQTPNVDDLISVGLPWVEVITVGGEEPTCDYVSPPEGGAGTGIANATKVPGRLRISVGGEYVYDSGDYVKDTSGMTIKIRGNSSAYEAKKPYKVKLEKKADLLCRADDAIYGDKEWLLMKDEYFIKGGKLLHMMIGLKATELCGVTWEPQAQFVNLTVNGNYRGVYMLCESVKRNEKSRVNVDKTGYIVEMDPYWWNEDVWFSTTRHEKKYTFKYPDSDDVTAEQVDYIKDALDNLEDALWTGAYPSLLDVESMATWLMVHDILGTNDAYGSNIFFTKYDNTPESKVAMGPLWDFDTIMETERTWATIHDKFDFYIYYLLCLAPGYSGPLVDAYFRQWQAVGSEVPRQMVEFLQNFLQSEEADALQISNEWDLSRWQHTGASVEEMGQAAIRWFTDRETWMSEMVSTLSVGKIPIWSSNRPSSSPCYDLIGRRVPSNYRGFVISGQRIYMK